MTIFNLWRESFIFLFLFSVIIIIPCILVTLIGRKMIDRLGLYPSQTPAIQMGILFKLLAIEFCAFGALISFFYFFES